MSADNWAICPRCRDRERVRLAALQERVSAGYGAMPMEEFDALRAEASKPLNEETFRTFREDYEIGVETGGLFEVNYGGSCDRCGLEHSFKHTTDLMVEDSTS